MSFEKTLKGQKLPFAKLERFWKMSLSSGLGLRVRPSIEFTLNRRLPFFIVLESSSGYRKNIPIQSTLVLFFWGGGMKYHLFLPYPPPYPPFAASASARENRSIIHSRAAAAFLLFLLMLDGWNGEGGGFQHSPRFFQHSIFFNRKFTGSYRHRQHLDSQLYLHKGHFQDCWETRVLGLPKHFF